MDFVELMTIAHQLCNTMDGCDGCRLWPDANVFTCSCGHLFINDPVRAQEKILAWKTEYDLAHSKTLAQKFKEIFPDAPVSDYPNFCPAILGKTFTGPDWKTEDHCGNGCKSCWEFRVPDDT